ncbi:hypothetical protein JEZ13_10465 [bacterium]|nr:hypothetical protein [bacterium]
MNLAVDLHSHSGYAGGVGTILLEDISRTMKMKGIDVFGTGDVLLPQRYRELENLLIDAGNGLFKLSVHDTSSFLLQTEVILTVKLPSYKNKIVAHHIILFPNFDAVKECAHLMEVWKQKNTIGRPFIVSDNREEMILRLQEISSIHPEIEIIPAHIMTPDGVMGCKNMLKDIEEFYGSFLPNIHAVETGLSADPELLAQIPKIADLTFISNSDCHSSALNRVGREFTVLDVEKQSYSEIINSIRKNKVVLTAEFNPAEGRYYRTGHAGKRHNNKEEFLIPSSEKVDLSCPICSKKMTLGVYDRVHQLRDPSIIPRKRKAVHLIPLIEVIAYSLNLKSVTSYKVMKIYEEIIRHFNTEIRLWLASENNINDALENQIPTATLIAILAVKAERFEFAPPGYDGEYGKLVIK